MSLRLFFSIFFVSFSFTLLTQYSVVYFRHWYRNSPFFPFLMFNFLARSLDVTHYYSFDDGSPDH